MDLHRDAEEALRDWPAPDPSQRALRDDVLALLGTRPDALRRSCRPDHVTASAFVTDPEARHVLLVLHGKVGRWLQPGGHCEDADATLAGAARREAQEETGVADLRVDPVPLDLDRHPAPCSPDRSGAHLDVRFWAVAPADARPVRSAESADVRWWPVDGLPDGAPPDLARALRAAGERARSR